MLEREEKDFLNGLKMNLGERFNRLQKSYEQSFQAYKKGGDMNNISEEHTFDLGMEVTNDNKMQTFREKKKQY